MDWQLEHFMANQRKRVKQQCKAIDQRIEYWRQKRREQVNDAWDVEQRIQQMCHAGGHRKPDQDHQGQR